MVNETITSLIAVLKDLTPLVYEHLYIIAALTPILGGEVGMHVVGIVSGTKGIIAAPFFISIVSVIVFDMTVYCTVAVLQKRYNVKNRIESVKILTKFKKIFQMCEERLGKTPTFLLIVMKLLPATKITIVFFSVWVRMPILQFLLKSVISTTIYACILFLPGWLIGKEVFTQTAGETIINVVIYLVVLITVLTVFGDQINAQTMKIAGRIAQKFNKNRENS